MSNIRYDSSSHGFGNRVGLAMSNPFGSSPSEVQQNQVMTDHWEKVKDGPVNAIFSDIESGLQEMVLYHSPSFNGDWGNRVSIRTVKNLKLSTSDLCHHMVDILLHNFITEKELQKYIKQFDKRKSKPERQCQKKSESLITQLLNKDTNK